MGEVILKIKENGQVVECLKVLKINEYGKEAGYVYIEIKQGSKE